MPAYRYEAVDAAGAPRTGVLDGDTARAVRAQLRAQALVPKNGTVTTMKVKQNNESNGSYAFTCRVNWSSSTKAKPTWMPILFGPVWS